jgi:hypothetical protein
MAGRGNEILGNAGEDLSATSNLGLCVYLDSGDAYKVKLQTSSTGQVDGILTQLGGDNRPVAYVNKGLVRARCDEILTPGAEVACHTSSKVILADTQTHIKLGTYVAPVKDSASQSSTDEGFVDIDLYGHNNFTVA